LGVVGSIKDFMVEIPWRNRKTNCYEEFRYIRSDADFASWYESMF